MKKDSWFYRYAVWAEEQDDLDAPILVGILKFMVLQMIPLMVLMLFVLVTTLAILVIFARIGWFLLQLVWI